MIDCGNSRRGLQERGAQWDQEVGDRRHEGGERPQRPPPPGDRLAGRRRHAPQVGEDGQAEEEVEKAQRQRRNAEEGEARARFLPPPDLIAARAGLTARERLGEPVCSVAHRLLGDVVARVGGDRLGEPPRRARGHVAVDAAGLHSLARAEERHGLGRGANRRGRRRAPHQRGELVEAAVDQGQVARPGGRALLGEGLAGGGALQHHRLVGVRHGGGGGQHRPPAHGVAFQPDVGLIHEGEGAQVGQALRPAEALLRGRPAREAVAPLIEGQHHIAAAGELDGESVLRFAGVDVAVHRQHARRRVLRRCGRRAVEEGGEGRPIRPFPAHVGELHPARPLDPGGEEHAQDDQDEPDP